MKYFLAALLLVTSVTALSAECLENSLASGSNKIEKICVEVLGNKNILSLILKDRSQIVLKEISRKTVFTDASTTLGARERAVLVMSVSGTAFRQILMKYEYGVSSIERFQYWDFSGSVGTNLDFQFISESPYDISDEF